MSFGTKTIGKYTRNAGRIRHFILSAMVMSITAISCSGDGSNDRLHESFDIGLEQLKVLTSSMTVSIRSAIHERPWYFLQLSREVIEQPLELIALVDKSHSLPESYAPSDLIDLTDYDLLLNRSDLSLRRVVMPDLLAMVEAARIEEIELMISSTYRSFAYQASLYDRNVEQYGKQRADRESAQPGRSQHQLGTVIDFGSITDAFGDTDAGKWLMEHAWEYGFSLSYPDGYEDVTGYRYEIWHFRFLSRAVTRLEREFFESVQHYLLTFFTDRYQILIDAEIE